MRVISEGTIRHQAHTKLIALQNSGLVQKRARDLSVRLSTARSSHPSVLESSTQSFGSFQQEEEELLLQHLQSWQTADVCAERATPYAFATCTDSAPPFAQAAALSPPRNAAADVRAYRRDGGTLARPRTQPETPQVLQFEWPARPRLSVARRRECLQAGRMSYDGERALSIQACSGSCVLS